jgi:hypothetical protein
MPPLPHVDPKTVVILSEMAASLFLESRSAVEAKVPGKGSFRGKQVRAAMKPKNLSSFWVCGSHALIVRAASAFWRYPGDDLVGICDVAGLAVDAI